MALILLQNNGSPLGQFDGYDNLAPLGGEVAKLVAYNITGSDKRAKDVDDGYSQDGAQKVRPIVSLTMTGSETAPFFLCDDGTANYGTLFGTVVGGTAGQVVSGGTNLGPNTMAASGKVTLWMNPGLYGVTLDALQASLTPSATVPVGTALSYDAGGKLALAANKVGSAPTVARAVEFTTGDTLVTTPKHLTALGTVANTHAFKYLVVAWAPPVS